MFLDVTQSTNIKAASKLKIFALWKLLCSESEQIRCRVKKIFANHINNEGAVARRDKEVKTQQSENKWTNLKNMQKTWTDTSPVCIQMANKHMKRCSASLAISEKRTKTTMKYQCTPVEWQIKETLTILSAAEDMQ